MNLKRIFASLTVIALFATGCSAAKQEAPGYNHSNNNSQIAEKLTSPSNGGSETSNQKIFTRPLKYTKQKQFEMMPLDSYGRALGSHIQLSENQAAFKKRSPYLTIRPSGWHNYKYNWHGKTAWLFNRGHLVGYQFCGINQAPGNMITQTQYVNQGGVASMDSANQKGQLYYEESLRSWLINHPNFKLDYSVIALYKGSELVPRSVRLSFVGYNQQGQQVPINIDSPYSTVDGKIESVTLPNTSPLTQINYQTGMREGD